MPAKVFGLGLIAAVATPAGADDSRVLAASAGARLGLRGLLHPHVNEQPFTGALMGVVIPDGAAQVFIR